jgi:SLOG family YspA-like protein
MTWRILVTGSRDWTDVKTIAAVLFFEVEAHPDSQLVVGDATGADALARDWWVRVRGAEPEVHYADWKRLGKAAGPARNQVMVDSSVDVCHAFPLPNSRGTFDCMRRAAYAGAPVYVHEQEYS